MDDYSSEEKNQDALAFMQSRFGQHYIARLEARKARAFEIVTNYELSDSFRAHAGTEISTVQKELNYFKTHQDIAKDPSFMDRLREKLTNKGVKRSNEPL